MPRRWTVTLLRETSKRVQGKREKNNKKKKKSGGGYAYSLWSEVQEREGSQINQITHTSDNIINSAAYAGDTGKKLFYI